MLAILVGLAWLLGSLVIAIQRDRLGIGQSVREAMLAGCALSAALVVAFTELLSAAALLAVGPVLACWATADLLLLGYVLARRRCLRGWIQLGPALDRGEVLLLALSAGVVALTGAAAVLTPPSNWDSLAYHLPRQVRWIQQASVAHFPTDYDPQVSWPPLVEFIGTHLMILSGGDHWANLVQWFALVMTLLAVSLLARDLGLNRAGQLMAVLFTATIPMAFLQAMSPKNDLVVSLWLCSAAWWCVRLWTGRPMNPFHVLLFGITLGLLGLTKGTGYLFAIPVAIVAGLGLVMQLRGRAVPAGLVICAAVVALNAGHLGRNYHAFGSIFGTPFTAGHSNSTHEPRAITANAVRNIALHLATPSKRVNQALVRGITALHRWFSLDVNDPRTSFDPGELGMFQLNYMPTEEDLATAPAHVALLLLYTLGLPYSWRRLPRPATIYLLLPYGGFLVFCTFVKWQPFHSRLHLPMLCLFAVVLAEFCTNGPIRKGMPVVVAGLILALAPTVYRCEGKSFFTRNSVLRRDRRSLMFTHRPYLREPTEDLAGAVAQLRPRTVGLVHFASEWEYPLERLILDQAANRPIFTSFSDGSHALASRPPRPPSGTPDVVIGVDLVQPVLVDAATGTRYLATWRHAPYTLYLPQERVPPVSGPENPVAAMRPSRYPLDRPASRGDPSESGNTGWADGEAKLLVE